MSLLPPHQSAPTARCIGLTQKDCQIIIEVSKAPNGISTKNLSELTGLSRSTIGEKANKKLSEERRFLTVREIPNSNSKIPAAKVYSSSGNVTEEELQYIVQLAQENQTYSSSLTTLSTSREQEPTTHQDLDNARSVAEAIQRIKSGYRQPHLRLLAEVVRLEEVSTNQLIALTGQSKQTTHSRLEKLREVGILDRQRRNTGNASEYVYFLAPGISSAGVLEILRNENLDSFEFTSPSDNLDKQTEVKEMASPSSQPTNEVSGKFQSSRFDKLAERLPEFDPTWSDDLKQKWFTWYDRLLSAEDLGAKER
ncbi:helix-turn-helix domain-containing protein [Leptolyngbya sp. AS-A5]